MSSEIELEDNGFQRGTVGWLRKELDGLDDNLMIVMSKDAEGNDFSPLWDFDLNHRYLAYNTWSGEIHVTMEAVIANGWDPEQYEPVEADCGEPKVLVLWPVN